MKIALVYDRINKWGGAERVLLALHKIWPEAPLYTGVYNPETARWAKNLDVHPSFIQKVPLAKTHHEWFPWIMTLGFETMDFSEYDVVISVTSAEAKGIITRSETLHICYCLTPTRYLWSHRNLYLNSRGKLFNTLARPIFAYLRKWDKIAAQRPDYYVAISEHVCDRIKRYYGRESEVVYPPVNIFGTTQKTRSSGESVDSDNQKIRQSDILKNRQTGTLSYSEFSEDYYLCVSRLVPYKRVDITIQACNKLKLPLVIVGTGVEEKKLRKMSGGTVQFVFGLTDRQLLSYYQGCRALIVPQEEDFGLSIVEAQAEGKPVIAYKKGGAEEIVREGETGEFFNEQTVDSLTKILEKFDETKYDAEMCRENVKRFGEERFSKEFSTILTKLWQEHQKNQI